MGDRYSVGVARAWLSRVTSATCGVLRESTCGMSHHEVLKANADGVSVILTDHSNTERGFLPVMKAQLRAAIGEVGGDVVENVEIHITELDADPLVVV